MGNRIIHAEVVGRDGKAIQKFFGDVFEWDIDTNFPGGYGMTKSDETGLVFGSGDSPDGGAGHVTFYVGVDDLDATLARAVAAGGRVVVPKMSPAPDTWIGLVADPEGHVIGVSQM